VKIYTRIFDFFWAPFAAIAKVLIEFKFIQRSRFAPWVLGACVRRWPERVTDINPEDLELLSPEDRELVLNRASKGNEGSCC
jgi:hypothetical protein